MQYEEFISLREFSKGKENKVTHAWKLAKYYYGIGEYSPALYFFSYTAEHSVDDLLSYECLMMISLCFKGQGDKEISRMNALETAISLYPHRPEAFYLKSRCYLDNGMYDDCLKCIEYAYSELYYMSSEYGNGRNDQTIIISWNIEYFGTTHFQYIKGLCHYYKGDYQSALECFDAISEVVYTDLPLEDGLTFKKVYEGLLVNK